MATLTKENLTEQQLAQVEYNDVCTSFIYYLQKYGKIVEPSTPKKPGGVISFQFWPHLKEGLRYFDGVRYAGMAEPKEDDKPHLCVLKARQIGWSWLLANYALWLAITKESATILMFSKGEKECWELLGKVIKLWENLPPLLKIVRTNNSKEEQTYVNGSTIKAFAATESAGIGEAATLVIADEWEYHPFARRNFDHAKPTVDSSGGQWISVFTVDKLKPNTFAKSIFKRAYYDGEGEFNALFHPYTSRPGRDEKWYAQKMSSLTPDDTEGLSPELYMQQSYPRTVEEALSPVDAISAFDIKTLDSMQEDCRPPLDLKYKYPDLNHKICNIFKDFQMGKSYVAATDSAAGVGKDYSVTVVMDVRTGEVVADVMSNRMPIEHFTWNTVQLLKVFHNPKWFPEDNNMGVDTIRNGKNLEYPNFGHYDKKKEKIGFHSNDANRTLIWGMLQAAINNRQVVIYNKQGLAQYYDVFWNTEHNPPRLEAMPGRHDDYCTAVAIALWACEKVPMSNTPCNPIHTLDYDDERDDFFGKRDLVGSGVIRSLE